MTKRTAFLAGYQAVVIAAILGASMCRQAVEGQSILSGLLFMAIVVFGAAIWFPLWLVRWK